MKKKILYIYHLDASIPRVQSGRPYAIYNKFIQDHDVECRLINLSDFMIYRTAYLLSQILFALRFTNGSPLRSRLVLRASQSVMTKLLKTGYDYIFSPTSLWWLDSSTRIKYNVKSICCIDIHLHGYIDLYGYPGRRLVSDTNAEIKSLRNFDCLVFPSGFAANYFNDEAHIDIYEKSYVIPFGANLPTVYNPSGFPANNVYRNESFPSLLNIVVISSDWERKGGDLIVAFINVISELFAINLVVIGEGFSRIGINDSVRIFHYKSVNKSIPEDSLIFDHLMRSSDFFLMPSKGEAFGMAVCEALAYGIIPIISSSGGLAEFSDDLELIPRLNDLNDVPRVVDFIADFCAKSLNSRCNFHGYLSSLYFKKYNWNSFYHRFKNLFYS